MIKKNISMCYIINTDFIKNSRQFTQNIKKKKKNQPAWWIIDVSTLVQSKKIKLYNI